MAQTAPVTPAPMQQGGSSQLTSGDKNFLENAAQAGLTEIEGSKLAQSHSKSADVKAFAEQMIKDPTQIGVSAHEDAVKLFQKASTDAKDPDIKAFAAKNLPDLEQHLEMAKSLKQKVSPSK